VEIVVAGICDVVPLNCYVRAVDHILGSFRDLSSTPFSTALSHKNLLNEYSS